LLPKILHERGYLIPAFNTDLVDYEACAERLARSIQTFHPDAHVTILTRDLLPFADQGGFANDWQCWHASPYRETIKLEADMLVASPIDHWWSLFEHRDMVISSGARDFYGRDSLSRHYRKLFDVNDLPDVYNAITYWRLSETSQTFFALVKDIFSQWECWKTLLKFPEDSPSTDVVYAMAAKIMEPENVTLPKGLGPNIIHMKKHVIKTKNDDWTQELVWETEPLRIQTVAQWGFFHYHIKDWKP
jgi:hypothetical protein